MLRLLFNTRVHLGILFFGAFAVIALIKLTALLPERFYFSFSRLVAGASEPFIVEPPGLTGQRLCALLKQNRLSAEDLGTGVDCNLSYVEDTPGRFRAKPDVFGPAETDKVYAIALTSDAPTRAFLERQAVPFRFQLLTEPELRALLADSSSIGDAYRQIVAKYYGKANERLMEPLMGQLKPAYAAVESKEEAEARRRGSRSKSSTPPQRTLVAEDEARIQRAHAAFARQLALPKVVAEMRPIAKSNVDTILSGIYSKDVLDHGISQFYIEQIESGMKAELDRAFAAEGLKFHSKSAAQRLVLSEVLREAGWSYLVAGLVRLLPVLLFGVALGLVVGRAELFSISMAGALAAFLLAWPIVLLWDRVVTSSWADKKTLFVAFYAVYIASFFLTARFGGMVGGWLRQRMPMSWQPQVALDMPGGAAQRITLRDIAVNAAGALVANGAVYAINALIPFRA